MCFFLQLMYLQTESYQHSYYNDGRVWAIFFITAQFVFKFFSIVNMYNLFLFFKFIFKCFFTSVKEVCQLSQLKTKKIMTIISVSRNSFQ